MLELVEPAGFLLNCVFLLGCNPRLAGKNVCESKFLTPNHLDHLVFRPNNLLTMLRSYGHFSRRVKVSLPTLQDTVLFPPIFFGLTAKPKYGPNKHAT